MDAKEIIDIRTRLRESGDPNLVSLAETLSRGDIEKLAKLFREN